MQIVMVVIFGSILITLVLTVFPYWNKLFNGEESCYKHNYLLKSGSTKKDKIRTGTPYLRTDSTNALQLLLVIIKLVIVER